MKNKNYYLYKHIRLDKNEVFYVGIGSSTSKSKYGRAYKKTDRNKFWHNIVNKTDYKVEIVLESDNYEFIKEKEIEFIDLYGRKDLGKGTLCNLTDGGEGTIGMIVSQEFRDTVRKRASREIFVYDLKGNYINKFSSSIEALEKLSLSTEKICWTHVKNGIVYCKGYLFSREYKGLNIEPHKKYDYISHLKEVYQYDKEGKFIQKHESITKASYSIGCSTYSGDISKCCNGKRLHAQGYKWSFEYQL